MSNVSTLLRFLLLYVPPHEQVSLRSKRLKELRRNRCAGKSRRLPKSLEKTARIGAHVWLLYFSERASQKACQAPALVEKQTLVVLSSLPPILTLFFSMLAVPHFLR
jgi:hypothetical protein